MAKAISKPLALAVAVGLTLGGSFSAGAPAFAQVDVVEEGNISPEAEADATQSLPGATTIPAGNVFSLTLHKRLNPTSRGTATGEKTIQSLGDHYQVQNSKSRSSKVTFGSSLALMNWREKETNSISLEGLLPFQI